MGYSCYTGPAVDVSELASGMGKDEDSFLYDICGMAHVPEIDALLEDDEPGMLPDDYLDGLFWEYAYKHLPAKYGVPEGFSYRYIDANDHWVVYCDSHRVFQNGGAFSCFTEVLEREFGADAEIFWLEEVGW